MMEILFRGKRIDNGEWVEGYVFDDGFVDSKRMFVGGLVIMDYKGTADDRWDVGTAFYEVSPNTICQFTGLLDKNGNKIWENDIIRHYNVRWEPEKYYIGIVRWNGVECRLENVVKDKAYTMNQVCKYEVIGNVFDNKELLEE